MSDPLTIGLIGNPNCGKTTLFNELTGLRQKVANYPGITVERKTGRMTLPDGRAAEVLDLPGTYSLVATSPDEQVTRDVVHGARPDCPAPQVILMVVDASTLARGLFLVSQVLELGKPVVIALTMSDIAARRGVVIDLPAMRAALGVPVVPIIGHRHVGIKELRSELTAAAQGEVPHALTTARARHADSTDPLLVEVANRYAWIDAVMTSCVRHEAVTSHLTERVDRVLLHRGFGLVFFAVIMATLFMSLFTFAGPLMSACQDGVQALGTWLTQGLAEGDLKSLINDGVFAGVGGVVVFVPQIALLFLFLALLEDSGYLARAAFLMDRVLCRVGLHGKSFIPLLSSFACAIPGIMAARTINSRRERLMTILVAPFMSCSARLPVYALLIAAFFGHLAGWQQGLIMLALYLLGILGAVAVAWTATRIRGSLASTPFILELPSYKAPQPLHVLTQVWQNTSAFLTKAGTTIFILSILIWGITTYPKPSAKAVAASTQAFAASYTAPEVGSEAEAQRQLALDRRLAADALDHSLAGRLGHGLEPVLAPLGYDWKMGIGLVAAFAAREVFVSTLGIVYSVGDPGDETSDLQSAMKADRRADGSPVWTTAVAISMLVWFVLAMQCMSTTAVVRRETGGWSWPIAQLVGMNVMAWICAFAAYHTALVFF
jgi:ferrous iron transport protein B